MHLHEISQKSFLATIGWAFLLSAIIIGITATLARASVYLNASVTEAPDVAIYKLLPEEHIGKSTLIRRLALQRDYLAETKDGPKLIRLEKHNEKWEVTEIETLKP